MKIFSKIAATALLSVGLSADNIVIVGSDWCPYNCEMSAADKGYIVDIAKAVFEKAGHSVEYKTLPWARCIRDFEGGHSTGLVGASKTEERVKLGYVFPEVKVGVAENVFFVKSDDTWKYEGIKSLEKIGFGAIKDYSYGDELDKYVVANANAQTKVQIIAGDSALGQNFKKILAGRIDATVEDRAVGMYELKKQAISTQVKEAGGLGPDDLYIAFSPKIEKSKEYAAILDKGVKELRASGELQKILDKYGLKDWSK